MKISYIGFGELIDSLESRFKKAAIQAVDFVEFVDSGVNTETLKESDLLLIGPLAVNPVKIIHNISRHDRLLAIVILPFPEQLVKAKQAILFSPGIGTNVLITAYSADDSVIAVLQNAARKTAQRRSFSRVQQHISMPAPTQVNHFPVKNLEVFFEKLPVCAVIYDENEVILSLNSCAKEVLGKHLTHSDKHYLHEFLSVNQDKANPGQYEPVEINGRFLDIKVTSFSDENKERFNIMLLNDLTDKRLTEQKLHERINLLEIANQDMEQFINVVSHDFKTPITSISLLTELILKGGMPQEKQLEFIKKIRQSSDNLKALLQGLIVLIDTKRVPSDKLEHLKFEDELLFIMKQYEDLLQEINAEVVYDFSGREEIIYLEAHLKSLISNMLSNAVKYRSAERQLRIVFKTRQEKGYVVLSVKDNGIGIDLKKNMDKLFNPFKRFTNQASGTGLGLSLIKRMIERNGGYVEVLSSPGEGTEFIIFLKEYT
ncbi:sensor histidine kinase [Desertivirga xinjiangensis]|uniref:sensor histidine kinase n=1 Tax=Desertivirga xinjiangensis TaxID=539206 RepID=UPI002108B78F|nr:HAMP domain-containing sensor histidine kinase [Pedobacter xinjiangensis]